MTANSDNIGLVGNAGSTPEIPSVSAAIQVLSDSALPHGAAGESYNWPSFVFLQAKLRDRGSPGKRSFHYSRRVQIRRKEPFPWNMAQVGFAGMVIEDVPHCLQHEIESEDRARVEMI